MSANAVSTANPPLPNLPCPGCGNNLLTAGFHNSCTETTRLREDYPIVHHGKLFLDHNEDNHEMIDHECDLEAYCSSCELLLPWALSKIRSLNGVNLSEADVVIAKLLADLPGKSLEGAS